MSKETITTDDRMQMRWVYPFPDIAAFDSRKKATKYAKKKFGMKPHFINAAGQCDSFVSDNGDVVCLVTLDLKDRSNAQRCALLAHECVHVVKAWLDKMEAKNPDEEQVAYGVQAAMLACIDQIGADKFFKQPEKD